MISRLETDQELRERIYAAQPSWGAMTSVASEATGTALDDVAALYGLQRAAVHDVGAEDRLR